MRKKGIGFFCTAIFCLSVTACHHEDRVDGPKGQEESDAAVKVEDEIQREMDALNEKENGTVQKGYDMEITKEETKALEEAATTVAMSYQAKLQEQREKQADSSSFDDDVIESLLKAAASTKEAVVDDSGIFNMENYEEAEAAFKKIAKGEEATAIVNQIVKNGSLYRSEFCYQDGSLTVRHAVASVDEQGKIQISGMIKNAVSNYQYSESGRVLYEEATQSGTEMTNGNVILRIRPQKQDYLTICNKYIKPIGYQGTNLFLTDWSTEDLNDLDLNDTFEALYDMKTQTVLNAERYPDGIPKAEFEDVITSFLGIDTKTVSKHAKFNRKKQTYNYVSLGCGNYSPDMWGVPEPEVIDVKEQKDGTVELTVQAVWKERRVEKAFLHKVTVRFTGKNGIQFLGNKVIKDAENVLVTYHPRLS